ncbi:MAG: nucleoside hydrolase, partial [Gemmatimonadales bacterium]
SEFNAWCDPEALDAVLAAEIPTEMIGLDVTRHFQLNSEDVAALAEAPDEVAHWLHEALRFYVEFHRRVEHLDGCVVNDPLAIIAVFRPDLFHYEAAHLVVDCAAEGEERGHTREDEHGARALITTRVDAEAAKALLADRVLPWLKTHTPTVLT